MNPTLVHNHFPMNYSLGGDFKYSSSNRQYTNSSLSSGDYLERKTGLTNGSLSQPMTVSRPSNGMDYTASQLQHDTPRNTESTQLILTPPHSGDEGYSSSANPSTSSFGFSARPKVSGSNASRSDYCSSAATGYLHSSLNGTNMTQFDKKFPLQIPAPLSPPYTYTPSFTSGSFPPFNTMSRTAMDYSHYSNRTGPFDLFPRRPHYLSGSFPPSLSIHAASHASPQRPEGPPFDDTQKLHNLVGPRGQTLNVEISAGIPKGFFRVDEKWTCYRRNYFTVSCGFSFKSPPIDSQVFLSRYTHMEQVHGYAVSISAKTAAVNSSESESRGLVQHTPKRDKATESVPTRHSVVPASPHSLPQAGLYPAGSQLTSCLPTSLDPFSQSSAQSPQTIYTFERIQFQKATANNGKRRAQQQYFHVVVNLEVNVGRPGGPDDWVIVATKQSHPMVVRGRSPGHYKDNHRDSQASMDPDGNAGRGGEGGTSAFPVQPFGPSHGPSINSAPGHYRQGHHYGHSSSGTSYTINDLDNNSSSSRSSTTTDSPSKGESCHLSCSIPRTILAEASYGHDRLTLSPTHGKISSDIVDLHRSQKRSFENDSAECNGSFFTSGLDSSYHNPSFDFSATSTSQPLCA